MSNEIETETPSQTPDDSQKVQAKTLAVATAVADLVSPVKQVLGLVRSVTNMLRFTIVLMVLLVLGLAFSLVRQSALLDYLKQNADAQAATTKQLAGVVAQLDQAKEDVEAVKEDVAEIPRIEVQPADPADPTSKPVAVLRPGKSTKPKKPPTSTSGTTKVGPPPKPAPIEIPLDLPRREKKK